MMFMLLLFVNAMEINNMEFAKNKLNDDQMHLMLSSFTKIYNKVKWSPPIKSHHQELLESIKPGHNFYEYKSTNMTYVFGISENDEPDFNYLMTYGDDGNNFRFKYAPNKLYNKFPLFYIEPNTSTVYYLQNYQSITGGNNITFTFTSKKANDTITYKTDAKYQTNNDFVTVGDLIKLKERQDSMDQALLNAVSESIEKFINSYNPNVWKFMEMKFIKNSKHLLEKYSPTYRYYQPRNIFNPRTGMKFLKACRGILSTLDDDPIQKIRTLKDILHSHTKEDSLNTFGFNHSKVDNTKRRKTF